MKKFQFQLGTIGTSSVPDKKKLCRISIPVRYDWNAVAQRKDNGRWVISIPVRYDWNVNAFKYFATGE